MSYAVICDTDKNFAPRVSTQTEANAMLEKWPGCRIEERTEPANATFAKGALSWGANAEDPKAPLEPNDPKSRRA